MATRLTEIEGVMSRSKDELRDYTNAHVATELRAALEAHRTLRVLGSASLFIGLVCVTIGSLI